MNRKPHRLGSVQKDWLVLVARGYSGGPAGRWYSGCGHYWGTRSATIRLCESLAKHGLLEKTDDRPTYKITASGRRVVAAIRQERLDSQRASGL